MKSYDIATGRIKVNIPDPVEELNNRVSAQQEMDWKRNPVTIEYKALLQEQFDNYIQSAMNNAEAGDNNRAAINLIKAKTIKERLMLI